MPNNVSLTGLNPTTQGAVIQNPTIDVDVLFPTGVANSVPTTCETIVPMAQQTGTVSGFLTQYKVAEQKANLQNFNTMLQSSTIDQLQSVDAKPGFSNIDTYLTSVENTQLPIQRLVNSCLKDRTQPNTRETTEKTRLRDESKARYEAIRTPEQRVSYYEGWFPLFRPMTEKVLFILFGIALFLLLLSTAIFLRMRGIELKVEVPDIAILGVDLTPYKGYLVGGSIFGVVGVLAAWKFGYLNS